MSYAEASTLLSSCKDGEVQLTGGTNSTLGRLQVCINRAWGTVCSTKFGTNEAEVVCQQLGFAPGECGHECMTRICFEHT